LVLAVDQARSWAGEVFAAISAAYREATGDPHALSDAELATLPPADAYGPGPGAHFCGDDHGPAVVRFHIAIDVQGECLDAGPIRAGLVEHLTERFNTTRVAVSAGFAISGQVSPAPGPDRTAGRPFGPDRARPPGAVHGERLRPTAG
jgi:hypothetical protein